ncbi:oligosaccharyltransferase complex subunit OSTC [Acrasis kona]|uniref:Oligosaccharyltransferase complex subunit OSTC n=1 Tax=Acrasis kona TaxID=1008807 RepID=A0AAW2ZM32_9EUKA
MDPLYPIFKALFSVIHQPNLKLKVPTYLERGINIWIIFVAMYVSYFFIMSGIIYDIINEPPSIGSTRDEKGRIRPQAIMEWRMNGQYMIEGFTAGFLFCLGGLGFIALHVAAEQQWTLRNRYLLIGAGVACIVVAYNVCIMFLKMKVGGYLQ